MYTWVKLVLAFIIMSISSLILYLCSDYLPDFEFGNDKDIPANSTIKKDPLPDESVVQQPVLNMTEELVPVVEPVLNKVNTTPTVIIDDEIYKKALALFSTHKYATSRDLLWKAILDKKLDETKQLFWQYAELLDEINTLIITTDLYVPEKIRHNIVSGDSLSKLARRYKTTVASIKKSNNIKPDRNIVFAGQVLMVYPGFWSIKVIKSQYRLILFDQGRVFKIYNIATGRQNRTPVGLFSIKTKQVDPAWTAPGKNIPSGDPENVLGTRWMGIVENKQLSQHVGYGIHGTTDPDSIGSSASNGCIRMRNEEVEELYDIVPYGTKVQIVE